LDKEWQCCWNAPEQASFHQNDMNITFFSLGKVLALGVLALASQALAQSTYTIDPQHSAATFSVRHMMVANVKGEFSKITGTIVYDPANLAASKIDAVIDATTVNTREPPRDTMLKGPDFFDIAKYPTLTFKSKEIWKVDGKLKAKGDLTIRGIAREVVLDIDGPTPEQKDPRGRSLWGASATTKVNRKDWGLVWNQALESGGVLVGDDVTITIDVEAIRNANQPASAKR
jgi:polyisoprenoid-binding protein YceI